MPLVETEENKTEIFLTQLGIDAKLMLVPLVLFCAVSLVNG